MKRLSPPILVLLGVGLALRLLWVAVHPVDPVSDFAIYHQHAETLAEHGIYSTDPAYSDAYWAPGWPVVLAGVYLVFGVDAQLGALFGVVLEWGAIVLAAVTAVRLLRPAFATGAVAAMCFYPGALAFAPVLGTEHLAALLFTALVVLLAFARPSAGVVLAAGLLEGALLLTRAEYGAAMAVILTVWLVSRAGWRRAPVFAALAAAGVVVCLGPWIARNASTFGEFIPTTTKGGLAFYIGTVSPEFSEPPIVDRLGVTSTTKPAAHDRLWWRKGRERVADDPLRWLAYDVRRIYYQYGEEEALLRWGEIDGTAPQVVAWAYWLAVVALALLGLGVMVARGRQIDPAWAVIAGSIVTVSVLKLAFVVNERDRLPLTYLLIVVAALGAQWLAEPVRRGRSRRTRPGSPGARPGEQAGA